MTVIHFDGRGRRESNTAHQSKDVLFQETYEMANMNMNGYEDYYNDNQENSRTGLSQNRN